MVKRTKSRNSVVRSKKSKGKTRKVNAYFKLMLNAKKHNLPSFKYKNKTYVGIKHKHLGMIYKAK